MENNNLYVAVNYALWVGEEDKQEMMEETSENEPFVFISGIGMTLERFESEILALKAGETFDFTIPAAEAYGEYEDAGVQALDRKIFETDGKLDTDNIFEGNVVALMGEDGQRYNAAIVKIDEKNVTVDFNHPLAGENLHFVGKVLVKREATAQEIEKILHPKGCGGCGGGKCKSHEGVHCGGGHEGCGGEGHCHSDHEGCGEDRCHCK